MPDDEVLGWENVDNRQPRAFIQYKEVVPITELVSLMRSFCDSVDKLSTEERQTALAVIKRGIENDRQS